MWFCARRCADCLRTAFETKLVAVNGITAEEIGSYTDSGSEDITGTKEHEVQAKPESHQEEPQEAETEDGQIDASTQAGSKDGECRLLGPFALFVQAGLGVLALSSLVFKRWRERPRRPMKVWFFDVSKQVVGSVLLHLLNVLMSMVSSEDYQLTGSPKQVGDTGGKQPNPCSFYLINIAVDVSCLLSAAYVPHADVCRPRLVSRFSSSFSKFFTALQLLRLSRDQQNQSSPVITASRRTPRGG